MNNLKVSKLFILFCFYGLLIVSSGASANKKYIGANIAIDYSLAGRLGYEFNRRSSIEASIYNGDDALYIMGGDHNHRGFTLAYRHNFLFLNGGRDNFFVLGGIISDEAESKYQKTKEYNTKLDWGIGFNHAINQRFDFTVGVGLSAHGFGINYSFD